MISSATLYRASGLALLLNVPLNIIGAIVSILLFPSDNPQQYLSLSWLILTMLNILSSLLEVGGLPGIYIRQCAQAGRLGLVGFVLTLVGAILFAGLHITNFLVLPYLAANAPQLLAPPASYTTYALVAIVLATVGIVLLGLATMRAGVFPRWAGLLLIVAVVINLVGFFPLPAIIGSIVEQVAGILFALGVAWMGFVLLVEKEAKLGQPLVTPHVGG